MIPVIIINGPLGSGKTTLIHTLLQTALPAERTIWLKTEFGDESIDEYVLKDTKVQTLALTGGCICHVLLSELDGVLTQLESLDTIDCVLIETSGMSHPVPVIQTIERHPLFRVAHTAMIVDTLHAGESSYPTPMRLPSESTPPYDVIICNKYPEHLTAQQEGEIEQRLDPWFDGVYAQIEKYIIPIKNTSNTETYTSHMSVWGDIIRDAVYTAQLQSPKLYEESKQLIDVDQAEDHEGDMDVLTFHIDQGHIVSRDRIEAYATGVPKEVVRIKGVFHTAEQTWEFFNWVRGTGDWTLLKESGSIGGQILLVIGHDIAGRTDIQSIDI
jgi:G3E family GTPase